MKKPHLLLSLSLTLGAMSVCGGVAHADLLTYFNFNDAVSGSTSAANRAQLASSDGGLQSSTISFNNFATGTVTNQVGTSVNSIGGDSTNRSLVLQVGSNTGSVIANNGSSIQFGVNTIGYKDTILTFATDKNDAGGFNNNTFSYSIDNGNTFTSAGFTSYNPPSSFGLQTFDLSSIDSTDNQQTLIFKLTFDGATGTTSTFNNRLDNIQINAMAAPEPQTWAMMALGLGALAMFQWKRKKGDGQALYASNLAI